MKVLRFVAVFCAMTVGFSYLAGAQPNASFQATIGPQEPEKAATIHLESLRATDPSQPASATPLAGPTNKAQFSIQYDDGTAENGYGGGGPTWLHQAMLFELPVPSATVESVSVCLQTLELILDDLSFDLLFYAADGPGGAPGTLIDRVSNILASDVPFGLTGGLYNVDLSALDVVIPTDQVYIDVFWSPFLEGDFFLCADESPGTPRQPAFASVELTPTVWGDLADTTAAADYRALIIRGEFDEIDDSVCFPGAETLCLNRDGRFKVEIDWADFEGNTGQGQAFDIGKRDSGLFFFFNDDNIELLIKVVDACNLTGFNSFWVFYAATTNLEFTVTVTDTQTDTVKQYTNTLGNPADPVLDTSAFLTCP